MRRNITERRLQGNTLQAPRRLPQHRRRRRIEGMLDAKELAVGLRCRGECRGNPGNGDHEKSQMKPLDRRASRVAPPRIGTTLMAHGSIAMGTIDSLKRAGLGRCPSFAAIPHGKFLQDVSDMT